jgi:nucleotide-binding universal stress UspA family protein
VSIRHVGHALSGRDHEPEESLMHAQVGDWPVIPPAPHEPPPDAHLQSPRNRPVVLVAVDGSESSMQAARWAAGLHVESRPSLRLACVVAEVGGQAGDTPVWLRELSAQLRRDGTDNSVDLIPAADLGAELTRLSAEVDLLVVGSYGEGSGGGVRVGSTGLGLLDSATCAVAVVRGREQESPIPDRGVVAVGVDGSPESVAALALAAELAEGWGATLLAVHTWREVADEPGRGIYRVPEDWDKMASDATALLAAAVDSVQSAHPDLSIERRVVADGPLSALLDVAPGARLIVVGSRGARPKPGMLMGSTSRGLVEFCPCPVLVVRPQAGRSARRLATTQSGVG